MNNNLQTLLAERFANKFDEFNSNVLNRLGLIIKQFEGLTPSQAYQLGQQLKYVRNVDDLINQLSDISGKSQREIELILEEVAKQNLQFADIYYKARGLTTPIYAEHKELQRLVQSIANVSNAEFVNLAGSTGFSLLDKDGKEVLLNIEDTYKRVVDECVYAITTGQGTYQQQMRGLINQLASSGVRKIEFASGTSRRLDSVARMNILDTMRQIHNESEQLFGQEFGADGVEISVHFNPAEDHEDIQGHQFSLEEFNKLQHGIACKDSKGKVFLPIKNNRERRPISQFNCYHYIFNVVLGVDNPLYSDKQLKEINTANKNGFDFEGVHYTNYEGTQLQRRIETAIRQAKDEQILAKASGDNELVLKAQDRITKLTRKYKSLCNTSGLVNKLSTRASVSGYKRVAKKNLK